MNNSKILYFSGCIASYNLPEISKSMKKIFDYSNIDYEILGNDELCCGSVLFRTGMYKPAKEIAEKNAQLLQKFDKIITACAGCFRTLKFDYKNILKDFKPEILHVSEFLWDLIEKGKLKLSKIEKRVTFHDPCHLGRHSGVFEAPRRVLNSIPGLEFIEMWRSGERSRCCGAGAGVFKAFYDLSSEVAASRIKEAQETDVEALVTSCVFCTYRFKRTVDERNLGIEVYDLPHLVEKALK